MTFKKSSQLIQRLLKSDFGKIKEFKSCPVNYVSNLCHFMKFNNHISIMDGPQTYKS